MKWNSSAIVKLICLSSLFDLWVKGGSKPHCSAKKREREEKANWLNNEGRRKKRERSGSKPNQAEMNLFNSWRLIGVACCRKRFTKQLLLRGKPTQRKQFIFNGNWIVAVCGGGSQVGGDRPIKFLQLISSIAALLCLHSIKRFLNWMNGAAAGEKNKINFILFFMGPSTQEKRRN